MKVAKLVSKQERNQQKNKDPTEVDLNGDAENLSNRTVGPIAYVNPSPESSVTIGSTPWKGYVRWLPVRHLPNEVAYATNL